MKKCLIITLFVLGSGGSSFAMNLGIRKNVVDFLGRYKNAYNKYSAVDHSNFGQALEANQSIGLQVQGYENELRAVGINNFNPHKDNPETFANGFTDEQLDAFGKRFQ